MFTGIVLGQGIVRGVERRAGGNVRLLVAPEVALPDLGTGESVAVDGVCLTVAGFEGGLPAFDAVPETLRRTTLGALAPGARVNLERALRAGDFLGGHWVQGHVEGTGVVGAVEERGDEVRMTVEVDAALAGAVIAKGSVALDGVSLTVGETWEPSPSRAAGFSVYLVPHTLAVTTLSRKAPGSRVNVEPDVLGRWVEHHVRRILAER